MMKPKASGPGEEGLLEYLEDIIGSAAYVERIAEAEKVRAGEGRPWDRTMRSMAAGFGRTRGMAADLGCAMRPMEVGVILGPVV